MAYSTYSDVQNEFKNINFTDGLITSAKVTEFISQADAYIDGRIGLIYDTPVTGTKSLSILKEISIGLVAQRISYILETKSITPKGDQYIPKNLIEQAEKRLDMIENRRLLLSDANERSTQAGVASYSSSNDVERTFKQGTDQW